MPRTLKSIALLVGALALLLTFTHCESTNNLPSQPGTMIQTGDAAPGAIGNVISLDQGWTDSTQVHFWFDTQGSEIAPYDYFLHLEQAGSADLFRSNENIERYRYLPQEPTAWNPDGLPVGFAKVTDPQSGEDWMGFTCAACHTAQLSYNGTDIRVDGGPTIAYYQQFQEDLVTALEATLDDDAKFERFADGVLGSDHTEQQADQLRNDLFTATNNLARRARLNTSDLRDGYARVDALGRIFNAMTAYNLDIDANARQPNAPVSYPFLWGTHRSTLVQWNGSVDNSIPAGPVVRNVGEVIGVFAHIDIDPSRGIRGYESSVDDQNLGNLEVWIEELEAPQWPENILPALDVEAVQRGRTLYLDTLRANCISCHALRPRGDTETYAPVMTPYRVVGTDPKLVENFTERINPSAVETGPLEGHKVGVVFGDTLGARASALDVLTNGIAGVLLAHPVEALRITIEDRDEGLPKAFDVAADSFKVYKARPLDGIWATAPYLHNGSVPTLYDLLLPVAQRPATFSVGSREFDPVKVGYVTTAGPNTFVFDTSLLGNHNTGHTYGADLSEAERQDLVEFLKSL